MDFYHGSSVKNLEVLKPHASPYSNMQISCVYMTTHKQLALHYIWDTKRSVVKSPMLNIRKDGILVFQEMFSGALEYFYKGLSGYIYHIIGDYEISDKIGVVNCAYSEEPVKVAGSEYIDDVYEKILDYGKHGRFIYEKFENHSEQRHTLIRNIIMCGIKRNDLLNNTSHPDHLFCQQKYPQYWEEALEIRKANGGVFVYEDIRNKK